MIKNIFKEILYNLISFRWIFVIRRSHKKEIKKSCSALKFQLNKLSDEKAFVDKWKVVYPKVDTMYYRYYSHFIGEDINILSDDILHLIIEPLLNNPTFFYVYSDKNMYGKILPKELQPNCLLRKMGADYMDADYHLLEVNDESLAKQISANEEVFSNKKFIIKPTVESMGGSGVRLFSYNKIEKIWCSNDGLKFDYELLEKYYKRDFVIQECVETSDFVKQFNPESFSTFRVVTYRSVKDDVVHILGIYMRVGPKGSFKDNVHCGGYAVPIDGNGRMCNYAIDENRMRYSVVNGIDLRQKEYAVPQFEEIRKVVTDVAITMTNHRLISFDVILDKNNIPKIIEFNLKYQTVTTIQTTMGAFFGKYTDEVIDYCQKHINNIVYLELFRKN